MRQNEHFGWPGWDTVDPPIGEGGFGTVYEIRREVCGDLERKALKVIRIPKDKSEIDLMRVEGLDDESISNSFYNQVSDIMREYKIMSRMDDNPNIVHCDDFQYSRHSDGIGWDVSIRMELLTPLMKTLGKVKTEDQIIRMGIELCNGLGACHEANIIHRDIKPQNIFVSPKGRFKLGDFGISRVIEDATRATAGVGTYNFMAPEVAAGDTYGYTADIYSLGMVLYWLLNEYRGPFLPYSPTPLTSKDYEEARYRRFKGDKLPCPKNGSPALHMVVLKACAFKPEKRYQSARELMEALQKVLTDKTSTDQDATLSEKQERTVIQKQTKKNKADVDAGIGKEITQGQGKGVGSYEKRKLKILHCVVAAVLVFSLFLCLGYYTVSHKPEDETKPVAETPWTENVLMSDEAPEWIVYNGYDAFVMGSDIPRKQIQSITFLDTLKDAPTDSWDVSENEDGSVLAWVKNGSELFFGANGGINAKYCKGLFYGYYNVSKINFNHCFHTDYATNMASMFDFCPALSVLDVSDFNTANVTDMSGMFYDCSSLTSIDLSGFNTSKVTGMSCMFTNCSSIKNLDLSSFDTSNVTSMNWMFNKCLTLSNLVIDGFRTTNVTDMGNMFFECPKLVAINGIEDFDTRNVANYDDFMESGKLVNGHRWEELFEKTENGNFKTIPFSAGDVITFGRYEQDNNRQNGTEPIEWLVLEIQNGKALLLSKYALDAKPYHDRYGSITWEDCSLREWLNGDFLNTAFSEAEKNSVLTAEIDNSNSQGYHEWRTDGGNSTVDKVFLLSDAEAWFYFGSDADRRCTPTAYASAIGADFKTENGEQYATGWWLRSPGENEYSAEYVNFRGDHISNVVGNGYVSIRPAVWVSSTAELKP